MNQSKSSVSGCPTHHLSTNKSDFMQEPCSNLLKNAHGKIPYNMTNDYMFRAVLQSNHTVLKGLLCSLLHLPESEIHSVEITNPVILGDTPKNKEFRLDINANLTLYPRPAQPKQKPEKQNTHLPNAASFGNTSRMNKPLRQHINLEMQVSNQLNWPDRSLLYLCRSFDSLEHGEDYSAVQPAIHIGFLDYTLFKSCPEFYATYKLINMKNHQIYSDNFVLNVVDLTQIQLATEEDKKYNIDSWASLMKATTWEEVTMLASKNRFFDEAVNTILKLNSVEQIRKRCRDREEYYQDIRNYQRAVAEAKAEAAEAKAELAERDILIQNLSSEIEQLKRRMEQSS